MANLLQQLTDGINGASFDASLTGEIGKLVEVARLAVELKDNPDGIASFAAALASLVVSNLPDGADVQSGLGQARAAIPAASGGASPDALADLSRFATLVTEDLVPLLSRSIDAARAIEGIAKAKFTCPETPDPASPVPPPSSIPQTGAGRAAVVQDRAADVAARVDMLPTPLNPGTFLDYLAGIVGDPTQAVLLPIPIPILDDIVLPVQTLGRWSLATPADIGTELEATLTLLRDRLQAATAEIDRRAGDAEGLETALRAPGLSTFIADYEASATAMAVALEGADAATATTEAATLDGHIATFETLRGTQALDFTALVPATVQGLEGLPLAVHDRLLHLVSQLEAVDVGSFLSVLDQPVPADAAAQQALRDHLAPLVNFMEDLGEKLDLSGIQGGVSTVATEAQAIADEISAGFASVATETRAAFAEVETAVQALPLDDLAIEIRAALAEIGDTVTREITDAFAPLRDALSTAITTISDAVSSLDAQAVADAVAQAVTDITAILQDPAIVNAVEEIRNALDQAAETAGNLSFAPVTDEVISLIEQMEQGLKSIDSTDLNDALIGLLNAALSVLPSDLRPVTQPLIDDLGVRIEQGPVELLEDIRARPQEVVDRIRSFDPGKIISDTLGGPFDTARNALQQVSPSALIGQLDAVLETEKVRLRTIAAPSRALQPVEAAFDQLLTEFDRLSPDTLLQPIEDAIETTIQNVIAASPVDEIFDQIDEVFDTIQAVLDTITSIELALRRSANALGNLQNPDAAIDAWRDAALDKISTVPNGAALATRLGEIVTAIDASRGADMLTRYDSETSAIRAALDGLGAEAALARMVALHQRLSPLVSALPDGADKTTLTAVLARFDPLDPAHTGGLRAAGVLDSAITRGRDSLEAMAASFADTLHGSEGALTVLRGEASDASLLRDIVADDIEKALVPVRFLIAQLGAAAVPMEAIADGFADLFGRLTTAFGDLLTGPSSLQAITDAVQQVVDTIRNIDLAFLREALEGVFQSVRSEIEGASPAPLILQLDQEFSDIIDTLDLSLILPASEIETLDQTMRDVIDLLETFNPATLVGEAVRQAYEDDVLPLVEALDVTPVFDALIEALRGLEEELEGEMGRINTAYGRLLAARPGGGSASASASLG